MTIFIPITVTTMDFVKSRISHMFQSNEVMQSYFSCDYNNECMKNNIHHNVIRFLFTNLCS